MKDKLILLSILLLALFLRLVNLDINPPALYGDELTLVYDAYSILKTGHDQTGAFLPLTFSMSEGRPPFYVYASIPLVALFGPNALSARLLSVFSGVGMVFLMYLLLKKIISKRVAVAAALFTAISPWDLSLSRGGFETHLALFLSLAGVTTLIFAKHKPWLLLLSALLFGLAIHTYHSYKVVLLLFLPMLVWFADFKSLLKEKNMGKYVSISLIVFVFLAGVWLYQVGRGGETRFQNTNLFNSQELSTQIIQKINQERTLDAFPLAMLLHNKPMEYLGILGNNYFSHFSVDFLFLHGDGNPRHNQALMGEMYVVDFLLILLGLIFLFWENRKLAIFLIGWLVVAPVATTVVSPAHALRSTFMLPPLLILSASGFVFFRDLSRKELLGKIIFSLVIAVLLFQFIVLADRLYFLNNHQFGKFWSESAKIASLEAAENRSRYDYVILSDRIDSINLAYPVYGDVDPELFQKSSLNNLGGFSFKQLGNVYLGSIPNTSFLEKIPGKAIYIGAADELPKFQKYDTIYGEDGLPYLIKVIE